MFELKDDWNIVIANTDTEFKFKYSKSGIEIIASTDSDEVSTTISFTEAYGLYRWLKMLNESEKLNEYKGL